MWYFHARARALLPPPQSARINNLAFCGYQVLPHSFTTANARVSRLVPTTTKPRFS
jgi:hypothetical protein